MPYEWEEWAMQALAGIEPYEVRQVLEASRGGQDLVAGPPESRS